MTIYDQIKLGMAKAFFASAWADLVEENGANLSGCEIFDVMPLEIDIAAIHAADNLCFDIVARWASVKPNSTTAAMSIIYDDIECIYNESDDKGDRELTPELFGHYCAMQSMGHGVGLESFGNDVRKAIVIPYVEFGSHSLQKEYGFNG